MADGAVAVGGALEEVRSAMLGLVNDPRARPRERVAAARVVLSAARLVREVADLRRELAAGVGIGEIGVPRAADTVGEFPWEADRPEPGLRWDAL